MGEIVGLAGLDGHGQQRFLETLAELEKPSSGALVLTEINTLLIGLGFQPSAVQAALGVIIVVLVSLYGRERHVSKTI
jgi:ribose transport system permease protein